MLEGWQDEHHFILFEERELHEVQFRYAISVYLPGYEIVGLRGWDDFLVRNQAGGLFTVPTVPLAASQLRSFASLPSPESLEVDERFIGKIKWYVKPIVFGGDPGISENLIWVDHTTHGQLVRLWNEQYTLTTAPPAPPN